MASTITITTLLQDATSQLGFLGKSARLDAEALLAHVMKCDRSYFRTWPEKELEVNVTQEFNALLERRKKNEPLAYLTGWKEFWSLLLQVTPATLIPRPETELLVEQALKRIPQDANWQIADLGTGSGAIAIAIARERPHCHITAIDISAAALKVAQANASRLKINNVVFKQGDWTRTFGHDDKFDMICSNPPYIDRDDPHLKKNGLPHEPQTALTPGVEGVSAIRVIVAQACDHLTSSGWLMIEHGYDQGRIVRTFFSKRHFSNIITKRDLNDQERLTFGQAPS